MYMYVSLDYIKAGLSNKEPDQSKSPFIKICLNKFWTTIITIIKIIIIIVFIIIIIITSFHYMKEALFFILQFVYR